MPKPTYVDVSTEAATTVASDALFNAAQGSNEAAAQTLEDLADKTGDVRFRHAAGCVTAIAEPHRPAIDDDKLVDQIVKDIGLGKPFPIATRRLDKTTKDRVRPKVNKKLGRVSS